MKHPQVIQSAVASYATCPAPSAAPLMEWSEVYPDGTVKRFQEVWTTVASASGTTFGLTTVQEVAA